MTGTLKHFAINAEDIDRARNFYGEVFGWTFTPWGPPGFYQTRDAGEGMLGSHRLYLLVKPGGSKLWKWSHAYDSKQKTMHFGIYPMVSLKTEALPRGGL